MPIKVGDMIYAHKTTFDFREYQIEFTITRIEIVKYGRSRTKLYIGKMTGDNSYASSYYYEHDPWRRVVLKKRPFNDVVIARDELECREILTETAKP